MRLTAGFKRKGRLIGLATAVLALVTSSFVGTPVSASTQAGSSPALRLVQPVVGIAATPSGHGYWRVASDGGVFTYGDAHFYGSTGNLRLKQPIVGIAATATGHGYWMVASDGGVFTFGDAHFYGSTGNLRLNRPIVGIAATPTGHGYWMVASDGGIFTFGDARFRGSLGAMRLRQPIAGIAASRTGIGYWLVARDGGIFTFGNSRFYGSLGALRLAQPIVGMTATRSGHGYLLVAADGGVFTFGDAHFYGSAARSCPDASTVGVATARRTAGYMIGLSNARTYSFAPGSAVQGCPHSSSAASAVALDLLARMNSERAARGIAPLSWDGSLASYATSWSTEMARSGFRHSNISSLLGRLSWVGENIAWASGGTITSGRFHTMWMQSQGHRDNMLSPYFNVVGIGVYRAADGKVYATQDFGRTANLGAGAASPQTGPNPFVRNDLGGPSL